MSTLFSYLAASDPGARERLLRLWRRSRLIAGVSGARSLVVGADTGRVGMRFPGDGAVFAAVTAFLTLCCHVSLVHLVRPDLAGARWPSEVFALLASVVAVTTWKLARLRQPPRVAPEALPDPAVDAPLVELHDFAAAMRRQLEATARLHVWLANAFFLMIVLIGGWGVELFLLGYTRFAELLFTAAALTASFVSLNWRPYALSRWRRALAAEAERAMILLADQIRRVGSHPVPGERAALEWALVRDMLTGWLPRSVRPRREGQRRRPGGRQRIRSRASPAPRSRRW